MPHWNMLIPALLILVAAGWIQDKPTRWPPKKGDTVVVRGCLNGSVAEAADLRSADGEMSYPTPHDYRLTGKKALLNELKEQHARHVDVITGVLKTDLPTERKGMTGRIGNTGVGIGIGNTQGPPQRALPVLEVTSFEHMDVTCR